MKLGYSQNINTPLCIASDTGIGGPRYIETTFPVEQFISPLQRVEFKLRCRAEVPIRIEPNNTATPEAEALLAGLRKYRPRQEGFNIYSKVTSKREHYLSSYDFFKNRLTFMEGGIINLPALGPGKYHDISVVIELSTKVFEATYFPEDPEPLPTLYLPVFLATQTSGSPMYAPYEVIVVMAADAFPDPCITPTVNIGHPGDIDFGAMSKEDLNQTITKNLSLRISRSAKDSCSYPLYPIITFSATDPVVNDNIELKNGTLLSLDGVKHSSRGNENFGKLKFNTPIRLGEIGLDENIILAMEAHLRKNPKKEVKGGAFSTTVIYHIEYR